MPEFRQAFCGRGFDQRCGNIGAERCDAVERLIWNELEWVIWFHKLPTMNIYLYFLRLAKLDLHVQGRR
jgi:hypothetical protein